MRAWVVTAFGRPEVLDLEARRTTGKLLLVR